MKVKMTFILGFVVVVGVLFLATARGEQKQENSDRTGRPERTFKETNRYELTRYFVGEDQHSATLAIVDRGSNRVWVLTNIVTSEDRSKRLVFQEVFPELP